MNEPGSPMTQRRGVLRRGDKIMSTAEAEAFLGATFCGRTASIDADGYPYVVPNLFVWMDGCVFLHTSVLPGHFLQNIRHCARVSFEVDAPGEVFPYGPVECDTSISYRSVIVFGRIRVVDDPQEKTRFFSAFLRKYAPPHSWGRARDSFPRLDKTIVYAITVEAMTGKQNHLPGIDQRWHAGKSAPSATRPTGGA